MAAHYEQIHQGTIEDLLDRFCDLWNRGDVEGACSMYDKDAVLVTPTTKLHGRDAILAHYKEMHKGAQGVSHLDLSLDSFRRMPAAPDVQAAVALVDYELKLGGQLFQGVAAIGYQRFDDRILIIGDISF